MGSGHQSNGNNLLQLIGIEAGASNPFLFCLGPNGIELNLLEQKKPVPTRLDTAPFYSALTLFEFEKDATNGM